MRKMVSGSAWWAALLSTALGSALAAQQPAAKSSFTEVLEVDLVNVDVVVVDKNGNLVSDLTREDFQIIDDGKKVDIGYFARLGAAGSAGPVAAPTSRPAADPSGAEPGVPDGAPPADPVHLVLFVDLDNLTPHSRNRVLGELAPRLATYGDRARIMIATFGPKGLDVELPFSQSPSEWAATLADIEGMQGRGALRQMQQRRLIESIERVLAMAEGANTQSPGGALRRSPLEEARGRLDELLGSARMEAESIRADALSTLRAVQTLVSVLSVVPGQKSLLYVGDGVPIRPGQDFNELLAEVFESDRRFAQSGGSTSSGGGGPGSLPGSPGDGEGGPGGAGSSAGATSGMPEMSSSVSTLRLDAMSIDLTPELRALTAIANSQRVTLYGLSTDAPGMTARADVNMGARAAAGVMQTYDTTRSQLLEQSLQMMAAETGGLALPPNAGVAQFLDRVVADRGSRYSLAYASPHGGDSEYHKIKVKVDRKGVRLRHREGYIDRPRQIQVGDQVAGALLLGAGDNPHRVAMELLSREPIENGEVKLSLGLRIPIDELQLVSVGDNHEAKLDLYVLSTDDRGSFAPMRYVAVTVSIPSARMTDAAGQFYGATLPLALKSGSQAVAVGVVEPAVQRTSVVRMELEAGDD